MAADGSESIVTDMSASYKPFQKEVYNSAINICSKLIPWLSNSQPRSSLENFFLKKWFDLF